MRTFSRCEIIGRRFPICHVHVDECIIEVCLLTLVEMFIGLDFKMKSNFFIVLEDLLNKSDVILNQVSSFKTSERGSKNELPYSFKKPPKCDELDFLRWKNCVKRDFTINGLLFDPTNYIQNINVFIFIWTKYQLMIC